MGIVFDIKEFAVHDGPGIRTTVFLKGCPLRCAWCHNPEGFSPEPQVMTGPAGTRTVGQTYSSDELAARLNQLAEVLQANEGGVTFSGGEPLLQAGFVAEVIDRLDHLHVLLDTCGHASEQDFRLVVSRSDLVFYDLKLMNPVEHRRWTGADNTKILRNLDVLSGMDVPFVVRVPLVPGVTDTDENVAAVAERIRGLPGLRRVDLLPYNKGAGGKYKACGMDFRPSYDESAKPRVNPAPFEGAGIEVHVR